MSAAVSETVGVDNHPARRANLWRRGLLALSLVALFALALYVYLHTLDLPFDRDSYDEGVYWQTLRAMGAGYHLYSPTFYSQPPAFLLSIYPLYAIFGQTLWSARLGIVVVALLGLGGAFLLGKALHGPLVGLVALVLLMLSPLYLAAGQTLQAEGPQVAFSMLAVAFAYLWWEQPTGWKGMCYAALSTLTLMLSILSKLFGVATLVPIGLLALAQCWHVIQLQRTKPGPHPRSDRQQFKSLLLGYAVFLIATLLILAPFATAWPSFWSEVVTFHTAAKTISSTIGNLQQIQTFWQQNVLTYTALYGTLVALWRRDWRVLPLLAGMLTLVYLLWQQAPLFAHHFVILVPALVGLSILGFGPFPSRLRDISRVTWATSLICLLLVLFTLFSDVRGDQAHYRDMRAQASAGSTQASLRVAHDLQETTRPEQFVITDAQFIAGLAQRNTPPELVDTSYVRINTGFVTTRQVIQIAGQPRVQAVLFYTGRLQKLAGLHDWVSQHFRRVHTYGGEQELWVKM